MNDTASESIGRRYQILGTLGQGGMGTVLLAKDRLDGRVALKRLTAAPARWKGAMRGIARADAPTPEMHETMSAAVNAGTMISPGTDPRTARPSTTDPSSIAMASTVWHVSGLSRAASPTA